jgi:acyl carrier protein
MNKFDPERLRAFLRNYVTENLSSQGKDVPKDLCDDCDLLLSGVIDSLGLLELMTAFQEHCGREIDFDALDPEQMTVVGPLCDFVSAQVAKG